MELFALSGMACDITLTQPQTLEKCMYPKMVPDYSNAKQSHKTPTKLHGIASSAVILKPYYHYHTLSAHAHTELPVEHRVYSIETLLRGNIPTS